VTLRVRLLIALLALALVPTAVFTVFTLDQLQRATERWFSPSVERSLESALEVSRSALARMEALAVAQADEWASANGPWALHGPQRESARARLRGAGVDFLQIYVPASDGWRLSDQIAAAGQLAPTQPDLAATIDAALDSARVVHSEQGVLAGVAVSENGEAIVVGMWVPPDFFAGVDRVGEGISNYRRLTVVVDLQRQRQLLQVSALAFVLVVLAIVLAASLAQQMTRPLGRLAGAIEQVSSGDLDTRVQPEGAREFQTLGASFNAMAERLGDARSAVQEAEREAAWREVARRLAHEFKNILTPMSLSLHRLRRRAEFVPDDQRTAVRESLEALQRGVAQMTQLAEQFSQYARLPDPRIEPLDLAEVTRNAAALHEHENVQVEVHAGSRLPVRGDSLLLSRAIHNLLLNACEASPPGGVVEVHTRAEAGLAEVEILDRGPGIPAALRDRIFEPYVSTKRRGSGLGLSLVRDIAQQHEGTVSIEDRDGGGARARLRLPLRDGGTEGA
jgi:nitrogen fixation/metabolism regulation signal transduction histidine kinase